MELLFVHLTDMHIRESDDMDILIPRAETIGKTICTHVTEPEVSMIIYCLTGDFSYSGKEDEFVLAELFIETIIEELKKRFPEVPYKIICVPGNHDCDFTDENCELRRAILESKRMNIKDIKQMQVCTGIQKNYFAFVQRLDAISCSPDRIMTVDKVSVGDNGDLSLVFHCINTSWCSDIHEQKGKMKFYFDELPEKTQNEIVFTLMHHDAEWLDWEDNEKWEEYQIRYSDVIMIGHDHNAKFTIMQNYDDSTKYYIKGNQLYDSKNPSQSGFNILKLNTSTMEECFFSYDWQESIYKRIVNTGYRPFERNQYSYGGIQLNKRTRIYLDSLDIDIKGKNNKELKLSDVFAFPTLKEERQKMPMFLRDLDSTIDFFEEKKWIVINGRKEYGKTTLLKWLFKRYFDLRRFPVFLDAERVSSSNGESLNCFVEESYSQYYDNLIAEEISLKDPKERVCFIDNIDSIRLNDKEAREFLHYLINKFGIVVITRNVDLSIVNPIKYVEMNDFLDKKFTFISIRPVESSSMDRLVNQWLSLDDENQGIDDVVFEGKRREKYTQIKTVMQKGFFNKTPLDLLLVLSYLDQDNVAPINYSKYSYVYEALILTKLGQIANKDANRISIYKTILQQIAYQMFERGINGTIDEQFLLETIFQYKESHSNLRLKAQDVVTKLIEYRFLQNIGDEYSFKYSYMYYYFIGNYIATKLPLDEKKAVTETVFHNLSDDTNYNVALFLLYSMNKEYEIIPLLREIDSALLTDYSNFMYDDLSKLIIQWGGDIDAEVKRIYTVPANTNIPELRKRKFFLSDEREAEFEGIIQQEDREPSNDELIRINADVVEALRLAEFSGNLLKNYSGELNNECRNEVISIIIRIITKIIGTFCKFSILLVNNIIDMVLERINAGDELEIDAQTEFAQFIKSLFAKIWFHFICLSIKSLASYLECDILKENIEKYVKENHSDFNKMIRLEYLMRTMPKLPVKEINILFKGKEKLASISQDIMKNNIYHYLSNYQYDYQDKQKVCSTLGFNIRDVFIEERKNEGLKNA